MLKPAIRLALMIGAGWTIDHYFHTGWVAAIGLLGAIDWTLYSMAHEL